MFYLVCYDIVLDRRRNKVAHILQGYGMRVQKSVFECVLTPDQREMLNQKLVTFIDADEDQVRFYPMSPRYRKRFIRGDRGFYATSSKIKKRSPVVRSDRSFQGIKFTVLHQATHLSQRDR